MPRNRHRLRVSQKAGSPPTAHPVQAQESGREFLDDLELLADGARITPQSSQNCEAE
jgi:hypothetical protein